MTQLIKETGNNSWSASKWLITIEMLFCPFDYSRQTIAPEPLIDFLKILDKNRGDFILLFTDVLNESPQKAQTLILQLINTSDRIFLNLKKISHKSASIPKKVMVRKAFLDMMNIIESLLDYFAKINIEFLYAVTLTKFAGVSKRTELRDKIGSICQKLEKSSCNPKLAGVIISNLRNIVRGDSVPFIKFKYAHMIVKKISSLSELKDEEIVALLIKYNFNAPNVFDFFIEENNKIINDDCLHTQIEIIVSIEESLNNIREQGKWSFNTTDNSIKEQLIQFFICKKGYLEKRLELRRTQVMDRKLQEDDVRIETTLTVAEMSFLIKLFLEHNIIPAKNIKNIFIFFAQNFSSTRTRFISSESMYKKASTVEFATARKVKGLLLTMVAWINKHHHVDNYT